MFAALRCGCWGLVCGLVFAGGCRGRAQQDLYQQVLQREVRQLEDQLYEADYENRILIEKLRRERAEKPADRPETSPHRKPSLRDPGDAPADAPRVNRKDRSGDATLNDASGSRSGATGDRAGSPKAPNPQAEQTEKRATDPFKNDFDVDDLPELDDLIDPGNLVDPGTLQTPIPTPRPDSAPDSIRGPEASGGMRLPGDQLLPPPSGPVPPGTPDLQIDPIEPGPMLPPNSPNGRPDDPPGKIDLPAVSILGGLGPLAGSAPKIELQALKIRIDTPTCIVRHEADKNSEAATVSDESKPGEKPLAPTSGVDLVLRADDQYGHPIALLGRSLDPTDPLREAGTAVPRPLPQQPTTLTVVALDPSKSGEEAQLGRWDFSTEQLRQLETASLASPASGFATTVPIRWQDRTPSGEAVVFFAQLKSGSRDLRCESEVPLNKQPSIAGWLPRR